MDQRLSLSMPPGIVKKDSLFATRSRWYDCNLVRFWQGQPQKWRGWETYIPPNPMVDPPRAALAWTTTNGTRLVAWGTAAGLYILKDGVIYDITPVGLVPGLVTGANGIAPRTWTLQKAGDDLIANPRGGTIFQWVFATGVGVRAAAISGAPAVCLSIIVTDLRFLVALGADSPLRVAWSDQEVFTDWTPSLTNKAGDLLVENGNELVGSVQTRGGWTLWTDNSTHNFVWVGGDSVFDLDRQGTGVGAISPNGGVDYDGTSIWMGTDGFYMSDGVVARIECDVNEFVFGGSRSDLIAAIDRGWGGDGWGAGPWGGSYENKAVGVNRTQAHKIFACINKAYNEVMWFYPSQGSDENDSYVTYSKTQGWTTGQLVRTTWIDKTNVSNAPLATGIDGTVYQHETGTTADGVPINYFLQSGGIEIIPQAGESASSQHVRLRRVEPDFGYVEGDHALTIEVYSRPRDQSPRIKGPYPIRPETEQFNPRARGRWFSFRWTGEGDFRMGSVQIYYAPTEGRE